MNTCPHWKGRCHPSCLGWILSDSGIYGPNHLERCDECARFDSDDYALLHATDCGHCKQVLAEQVGLIEQPCGHDAPPLNDTPHYQASWCAVCVSLENLREPD